MKQERAKRDMVMWSARLSRGRKSQGNGVGVGNVRGQKRQGAKENK